MLHYIDLALAGCQHQAIVTKTVTTVNCIFIATSKHGDDEPLPPSISRKMRGFKVWRLLLLRRVLSLPVSAQPCLAYLRPFRKEVALCFDAIFHVLFRQAHVFEPVINAVVEVSGGSIVAAAL